MGHIVTSGELESIEKPDTAATCVPASTPSTPLLQQSPTSSHASKSRRFQSCVSNSWHECVLGVSNLLPSLYAERWLRCLEQLLHNEGPLPEAWRIYIAILALCRHEVTWAVRALTLEFISADGDRKWLSGLKFAPKKLRALATINNILAHRPWLLTSQHILDLTKGEESWSISELCQALCIMTHFHSFASFLHPCLPHPPHSQNQSSSHSNSLPLTPRNSPSKVQLPSSLPDTLKSSKVSSDLHSSMAVNLATTTTSSSATPATPAASCNSKSICEDITTNGNAPSVTPVSSPAKCVSSTGATLPLTPTKGGVSDTATTNGSSTTSASVSIHQMSVNHEDQTNGKAMGVPGGAKREIQTSPQPNKQSKNESHSSRSNLLCKEEMPSSLREFPHLCHDITFTYEDFSPRGKSPSPATIFKIWEFNWQEHGYSLMTRVLNEMGNLIDERFGAVKTLSHAAWERNKDKSYHYKKAVWNFIQSLYGIHHDDYVYPQIDLYLSSETQNFIKKCCCWPESVEGKIPADLCSLRSENLPSQLVPLSILIMEARMESELLYALRAIIPHQR